MPPLATVTGEKGLNGSDQIVAHAEAFVRAGFAVVRLDPKSKAPKTPGWQHSPIVTLEEVNRLWTQYPNSNIGLHHEASGTCVLDVDHDEYTRMAFAALGLDLDKITASSPHRIRGKNGIKPLFRVPAGGLPMHKLVWNHRSDVDQRGQPIRVTVFELRAGAGLQDVLPGSIHPTGITYEWVGAAPSSVNDLPEPPRELLDLWTNWDAYSDLMACPWAAKPAPRPASTRQHRPVGEHGDVIGQFNRAVGVGDVLERNGYKPDRSGKRWTRPGSSTGDPGVYLLDDGHVFSHHAGDVLNDGHKHDAFDCARVLEHSDDLRAAIKACANFLGLDHKPAPKPVTPTQPKSLKQIKQAREWAKRARSAALRSQVGGL
jgi:putative DNA primase/helicase